MSLGAAVFRAPKGLSYAVGGTLTAATGTALATLTVSTAVSSTGGTPSFLASI